MAIERDPYQSLSAEYTAAMAQERSEWKMVNDASLDAVERVKAYARWLAAAQRIKCLSIKLGNGGMAAAPPCPP